MAQARATWPNARVMADGRVRIPAQGTYTTPAAGASYTEFPPDGWEIETIPDPDPKWDTNDAVRDANGVVFVRTPSGRWQDALGQNLEPVRPLTKLVPG